MRWEHWDGERGQYGWYSEDGAWHQSMPDWSARECPELFE